jgi:UDP-N-acetyl-D-glucosamine dehydrogenase
MPFRPGPGIGGHCIPKDPRLLSWKAKTLNFKPRFIELASAINSAMPRYAAKRITQALKSRRKPLRGSRILILGVAYKPGVADCRESPSVDVMDLLLRAGARVSYHDPFVSSLQVGGRRLDNEPLMRRTLQAADCVAILTAHRTIDYGRVVRLSSLVFDARHATKGIDSVKIVRL